MNLAVIDNPKNFVPFEWDARSVSRYLHAGWQDELIAYTRQNMKLHYIEANDTTSREQDCSIKIPTLVVSGNQILEQLPWLYDFYRGPALKMMQEFYRTEELICAKNPLYAINLQAAYDVDDQGMPMRYECHVDWAPTALLYATSHPPGTGGELVVANNPDAIGDDILDDCVRIYPQAGKLVCIDARKYPHYVEPLKPIGFGSSLTKDRPFRVVVVMLYCTNESGSCPESSRSQTLDLHLGHI